MGYSNMSEDNKNEIAQQQDRFKNETERKSTISVFDQFKQASKKARAEAATNVDLQEGDSTLIEVLIEKGATTEEFDGKNGKFSKVKYQVIDLETGKTLGLLLTAKQSSKADEELEKLVLRNLKPVLRITKVDSKTLFIEGVKEQKTNY